LLLSVEIGRLWWTKKCEVRCLSRGSWNFARSITETGFKHSNKFIHRFENMATATYTGIVGIMLWSLN